MNDNARNNMKQIVGAVERGEGDEAKSYWTRIGVGWVNRDGSINLKFDYTPTNVVTTIQLRDFEPREEEQRQPRERSRNRGRR